MKIVVNLLKFLVLFLAACGKQPSSQQYTQSNLPEGATARLGKGSVGAVQYSPDGTRLAVVSSVGIWLYGTATYEEIALLTGHTDWIGTVSFSPDGTTLASGSQDKTVLLWKIAD